MPKPALKEAQENQEIPVPEGIFAEPEKVENVDLNFGFGDKPKDEEEEVEDEEPETAIQDGEEVEDDSDDTEESKDEDDSEEADEDKDPPKEEEGSEEDDDNASESDASTDGEEDESDESSAEPEDASKKKKSSHMVPKSRLDEVLAKNKDLARKVEALEKAATPETSTQEGDEFDFDAKEMEYMDAVIEGDKATALKLRKEIDTAKQEAWEQTSSIGNNRDRQRELFEDAASAWEDSFDVLNPKADAFDEKLTKSVIAYTKGLQEQGVSPVDALNEATQTLLKASGYITDDEVETPSEATKVAKEAAKRKKDTTKKKIKAAKSQPRELSSGEGPSTRDSEELDVTKLTDEEFDALPEATKKKLRGDFG